MTFKLVLVPIIYHNFPYYFSHYFDSSLFLLFSPLMQPLSSDLVKMTVGALIWCLKQLDPMLIGTGADLTNNFLSSHPKFEPGAYFAQVLTSTHVTTGTSQSFKFKAQDTL